MARLRIPKSEIAKREQLLMPLLNEWVYFRYTIDNQEKFCFIKHRLREQGVYSKIEQIILSEIPQETGVYYITSYEVQKVYDFLNDRELIELSPSRYDLEIGIETERKKIHTIEDLNRKLIEDGYVTAEELDKFSDFDSLPEEINEEILMGMAKQIPKEYRKKRA